MKNKKSKENLIGKIIYGFLLFMPLLAIAVTCAYVIFNKNAYQSYYGENINNKQYVRSDANLDRNETYVLNSQNYDWELTYRGYLYIENFKIIDYGNLTSSTIASIEALSINRIYLNSYQSNTIRGISLQNYSNNTVINEVNLQTSSYQISFNIVNFTNNAITYCYYIEYNNFSYLSNTFYYAINEVEENNLFNWAKNTETYSVLNTTCQTLGITANFVPMLLSYWLMISLMYLLYDIALIMVHMAHNKIHEFEGSI